LLNIVPITLKEARRFVTEHHRHRRQPPGGLFAVGLAAEGKIAGCVIVGRPVARLLDDDYTAEITRLCTDGSRNACSMLYGAAWRAARAMGYRRLITYTLPEEGGTSLRASGWTVVAEVAAQTWHRTRRPRVDLYPQQRKLRWEKAA
jgi:hypothetical protein